MNKKDKITEKLKELFALTKKLSFYDCTLADGSILRTEDDAIGKGSKVTLISKDGVSSEVADGDVTSSDGSVITVKSGVVDSIAPASPEKANEKMEEVDPNPASKGLKSKMAVPHIDDVSEIKEAEDAPMDMDMLEGVIKNLVDRIAALESKISDTSMTVEKMSAAPAAKPFNFDPHGKNTIGESLDAYKAEHKAKIAAREKQMMDFHAEKRVSVKPEAQTFSSNSTEIKKKPFDFNFGGSFSIDNGK
ncbi:MAG TPA: hypothetical protein VNX68_12745 [Nitrosopumilaceae archaeon]|jgi:hypothetical protein|nr:hypothetical protein [Nitrosopumilaceae archaeon]